MAHSSTRRFGWLQRTMPLVGLLCGGASAAAEYRSMRDRAVVVKTTEEKRTVCVGRYLVDVPVQAEVSMSLERIDGFAIETVEETEAEFRARFFAREAEINALGAEARPMGPGLHEDALLDLWDGIVSSIRFRAPAQPLAVH